MSETPDQETQEIILSTIEATDGPRTLWVYDPRDDFKITIPAGARVTFGYFNPTANTGGGNDRYGNPSNGPGGQTMRTTCLRVYADKGDKSQLAAFLGVTGFRDMDAVKKTVMRRKVTIELNHEDDGIGNVTAARRQLMAPAVYDEDDQPF